jgi:homoserine kinase
VQPGPFTVTAPGSSANLGPGFDCLAVALPLRLRVTVEPWSGPLRVELRGHGRGVLRPDGSNLLMRALLERTSDGGAGLRVTIDNDLPLGAGCGSSGTAIVAGLAAAAVLRGEPLDHAALLRDAARIEGHPDNVAAAVYGGFTLAVGRPAVARRITPPEGLSFVLVTGTGRLATHRARAVLDDDVPRAAAVHNLQRVALLVDALHGGRLEDLPLALDDRLHETARARLMPTFARLRQAAEALGALGVTLSGAGPSVLVWTRSADADAVAARVREVEPDASVRVLEPERLGVRVEAASASAHAV